MKLRCKEFFKQITFSAKIMHKANGMTFFLYILLRLCIATLPLLIVPFFCIFLSYCAKQMGFLYLLLGICCSLFTLLIPIVFRKINLKYEKENWNYLAGQNRIFTQISQFAGTIKGFGLENRVVKIWKT